MDETAGTVLVISFVSLVVIISVLAALMFARNCHLRHEVHNGSPSMKKEAVEVLPSFTFKTTYLNSKHMTEICAICLEDYKVGESLRHLPCSHDFHLVCVDSWLMKWGTFCPVCKYEMSSKE